MLKYFLLFFVLLLPVLILSGKKSKINRVVTAGRVAGVGSLLLAVVFIVALTSLFFGSSDIDASSIFQWLISGGNGAGTGLSDTDETILFSIRLPRIIFAGIVGGALAAAGVVFQGLLRNPLADPYILGISGGAAVGALTALMLGILPLGVSGSAFLGAIVTIVLVYGIAKTKNELQSTTLLLAGVIVNAFFSAVIMFLISTASDKSLHNAMFWLMGDLSLAEWREIALAGLFLILGFLIIFTYARHLNLMAISEETAKQLGVNVEQTKIILLLAASLITGVAVSVSGIIGFVGLIVPHMMRILLGSDHRMLLPASILFGSSFLIVADTFARNLIAPAELPVGVITALCGAPYFIYLLRRKA
ncbi:MAG TPA: iron chelate uptake ABC transporter family permease subunit [Smithellaceae bacterium]|jgi:iron complex transport system permease protein|nr:iron chelate uptake ABC transporter family permease subunit [Smithellaceae bacterium]